MGMEKDFAHAQRCEDAFLELCDVKQLLDRINIPRADCMGKPLSITERIKWLAVNPVRLERMDAQTFADHGRNVKQ